MVRMTLDWFSVYAPIYDPFVRLMGIAPVAPLLGQLRLRAHERVLDVGGGTGRVAIAAAEACREVVVLDACPAMLRRMPNHPRLRGVHGRAQAMPFEDASFDAVLCVDALHHIKDAPVALEEMRRVLRPGGRLLVQEFDVRGQRGRAVAAFERIFVDDSRFLTPEALSGLLGDLGFRGRTERCSWLEYAYLGVKGEP